MKNVQSNKSSFIYEQDQRGAVGNPLMFVQNGELQKPSMLEYATNSGNPARVSSWKR